MKRHVGLIVILVSTLIGAFSLSVIGPASAATCSPNFFWDRTKPYGITNDQKTAQIFVGAGYQTASWNPVHGGKVACGIVKTNLRTLTRFESSFGYYLDGNEVVQTVAIEVIGGSSQGTSSSSRPTTSPQPPPPAPLQAPPVCSTGSSSDPSPAASDSPSPSQSPASDSPTVGIVSLSATASQIRAKATTIVYGYVADTNGCAMPGRSVALRYQPYNGAEYVLDTLVTDSSGKFTRNVAPPRISKFRAEDSGVSSEVFTLRVASFLSVASPQQNSRIKNPAKFSGSMFPASTGAYIGLAIWQKDHWTYVGHAKTSSNGNWQSNFRLPRGGLTLKAYVGEQGGNSAGETIFRIVVTS